MTYFLNERLKLLISHLIAGFFDCHQFKIRT